MLRGVGAGNSPSSFCSAGRSSPSAASSALPEATQWAGARPPMREYAATGRGLSNLSR